jgi:hypothetical protein
MPGGTVSPMAATFCARVHRYHLSAKFRNGATTRREEIIHWSVAQCSCGFECSKLVFDIFVVHFVPSLSW